MRGTGVATTLRVTCSHMELFTAAVCIALWWCRERARVRPAALLTRALAVAAATGGDWRWRLRGEGVSSAVFVLDAPRQLQPRGTAPAAAVEPLQGIVVRARKHACPAHAHGGGGGDARAGAAEDGLLYPTSPAAFVDTVLAPALRPWAAVNGGVSVAAPGSLVPALEAAARAAPDRESRWRRGGGGGGGVVGGCLDDPTGVHVTLIDDYIVVPAAAIAGCTPTCATVGAGMGVCVELKPKSGARVPRRASGTACRYCSHQVLKAAGSGARVSGYCPTELYSCEPGRVAGAVAALVADPQNNLRVLDGDGRMVYGAAVAATSSVGVGEEALDAALKRSACCGGPLRDARVLLDALQCVLAVAAPLLRALRALQEGGGDATPADAGRAYAALGGDDAAVIAALRAGAPETTVRGTPSGNAPCLTHTHAQAHRALLRSFLIAQTAKDVSLMIALRACECGGARCGGAPSDAPPTPLTPRPWGAVACAGGRLRVLYSIAVVDVDPRSVTRVPYYAAQDEAIAAAWAAARGTAAAAARPCEA